MSVGAGKDARAHTFFLGCLFREFVILSEVVVRAADDNAVEGPRASRQLARRLREFSPQAKNALLCNVTARRALRVGRRLNEPVPHSASEPAKAAHIKSDLS
jgi:hypothetical protein